MREADLIAVATVAEPITFAQTGAEATPSPASATAPTASVQDLASLDFAGHVCEIRGQRVLWAAQVAELFQVDLKTLNQAVVRHAERFPEDFVFRPAVHEWPLPVDAAAASPVASPKPSSKAATRVPPYAFTAAGVAMTAAVLKSPRALAFHIDLLRGVFARPN